MRSVIITNSHGYWALLILTHCSLKDLALILNVWFSNTWQWLLSWLMNISSAVAFLRLVQESTDDKSALVQVMDGCRHHYLITWNAVVLVYVAIWLRNNELIFGKIAWFYSIDYYKRVRTSTNRFTYIFIKITTLKCRAYSVHYRFYYLWQKKIPTWARVPHNSRYSATAQLIEA